jgi:hypothetical protein
MNAQVYRQIDGNQTNAPLIGHAKPVLKSRQDYCSVDETEGGGSATRNGEMSGKLP